MDVSNQIKIRRESLGLSQEQLAERIYVSRQTISNWERDKTYPDLQSLLLLSVLFDVSLDELVKGDVDAMDKAIERDSRWIARWGLILGVSALFAIGFNMSSLRNMLVAGGGLIFVVALDAAATLIILVATFSLSKLLQKYDLATFKEIRGFREGRSVARNHNILERRIAWIGKHRTTYALMLTAGGFVVGAVVAFFVLHML